MAKTIVHVGQMKSGTTYVQEILSKNRGKLLEQKIVYPMRWLNQQPAVYGICGSSIPWVKDKKPYLAKAENLRDEISNAKSKGYDVLLSAEALSSCGKKGIEEFLSFIGGADKAIFSVRSLHKTLPSAWQQTLKTGNFKSILEFYQQMEDTWPAKRGRWRTYAYGASAQRWSEFLSTEAYVVPNKIVDVNEPWNLFCQASGIKTKEGFVYPEKEENMSFSRQSSYVIRALSKAANKKGLDQFKLAVWYFDNFITGSHFTGDKISPPYEFKDNVKVWAETETDLLLKCSKTIHGNISSLTELIGGFYEHHEGDAGLSNLLLEQYIEHVINFYNKSYSDSHF